MSIDSIRPFNNDKENSINIIIEIAAQTSVKYEYDKEHNMIAVDRFMTAAMNYPCNYGFIPNTIAGDGDPVDILIITREPIIPGCLIKGRIIGVLQMEDESGIDEKILCVPISKCDPYYNNIKSYKDLPDIKLKKIEHFFNTYKGLEEGKWVKIDQWYDAEHAIATIKNSVSNLDSDNESEDLQRWKEKADGLFNIE